MSKKRKSDSDAINQGLANMVDIIHQAGDPIGNDEVDEEEEPVKYVPVGLKSREMERNELGEPQPRDECFACSFVGERDMGAVPYEDVMKFIDQMRKCRTSSKLKTLAIDIAEQYTLFQKAVNDTLLPGERPLPDWKPATILDHIRHHVNDAEMMLTNVIEDVHELYTKALHCVIERNQYGEERVNDKALKSFTEIAKLKISIYKTDPSKLLFYSGGAHVDMKIANNGGFSSSGKQMYSLFSKK